MRAPLFGLILLCSVAANAAWTPLPPAKAGQRVLLVAAHVDDEGLAAGGYAGDAVRAGADVYVVYLTAGDHSRTALAANRLTFFATSGLNHKGDRRLREGEHAAGCLGIDESKVFILGYPDRGLKRMMQRPDRVIRSASTGRRAVPYAAAMSPGAPYRLSSLMADLEDVIDEVAPDVVVAPSSLDHHPDHRAAAELVDRVLEQDDLHPQRLNYVIHNGTRSFAGTHPKGCAGCVVYPLGADTMARKRALLGEYRSQRHSPYLRLLFGRATRRYEVFILGRS